MLSLMCGYVESLALVSAVFVTNFSGREIGLLLGSRSSLTDRSHSK